MSTKNKLLQEIEKKAQKIRNKRVEAAGNKSLESAVFEFFKNIEESRKLHNGERYDSTLFQQAQRALQARVQGFDKGTKISVEFNASQDPMSWEQQTVRGVTIWWSKFYIIKNNVEPSLYVDVSQMLFW